MPVRGGSKGKKKPSIHHLSRDRARSKDYLDELLGQNDRACALVAASILSQDLLSLIETKLTKLTEEERNLLFYEAQAPLSSFSARIALSYALGLIPSEERSNLTIIRHIRNTFAHTSRSISLGIIPLTQVLV